MQQRTEVGRIEKELRDGGYAGEALLRKFRSASRGDIKLACALLGWFGEDKENAYLDYLKKRIRPAAAELIAADRAEALLSLEKEVDFSAELTDAFLQTAMDWGSRESIIRLLQMKERKFGFHDREFTWE